MIICSYIYIIFYKAIINLHQHCGEDTHVIMLSLVMQNDNYT